MIQVATELLKRWHPATAYTHSDEITLIFSPGTTSKRDVIPEKKPGYVHPFNGRVTKLCSVLASECGILFCKFAAKLGMPDLIWAFDARVLSFGPSELYEVANHMIFRQRDCKRNAVSTIARAKFGHKATMNKNTTQLMDMLQINPNDPETQLSGDMCGTFIKKTRPSPEQEPCQTQVPNKERSHAQIRHMVVPPNGHDILLAKYWPTH